MLSDEDKLLQPPIKIFNAGEIKLIDVMGNEDSIVNAARVSYDNHNKEVDPARDKKLIQYLYDNGHTSPFEHVTFTFYVKAPIFVFRQWHRHRTWSFNEISARYTKLDNEYYIPTTESIGVQSKDNKQMRDMSSNEYAQQLQDMIIVSSQESIRHYNMLIDKGCPREIARSVLPNGIYSKMFATVDLHNLLHFLKLRLHEHAQYEIRVYAEAILHIIDLHVPNVVEMFLNKQFPEALS